MIAVVRLDCQGEDQHEAPAGEKEPREIFYARANRCGRVWVDVLYVHGTPGGKRSVVCESGTTGEAVVEPREEEEAEEERGSG